MMDIRGKFGDCSFRCFGFIVQTDRQTQRERERERERERDRQTDADVSVSNKTCHSHIQCHMSMMS